MKKKMDKIHFWTNFLGIGMAIVAGIAYFGEEYKHHMLGLLSASKMDILSFGEKMKVYVALFFLTLFPRGLVIIPYLIPTVLLLCVLLIFRKQTASKSKKFFVVILYFLMSAVSFAFSFMFFYMPVANVIFCIAGIVQVICGVAKLACYIIEKKLI